MGKRSEVENDIPCDYCAVDDSPGTMIVISDIQDVAMKSYILKNLTD